MNKENTIPQLYSELSNPLDLPALAERCNLLTEILLDSHSLPQIQPVCRCLAAYLNVMQRQLADSMSDFQVVEYNDELPREKGWLFADTETKCDYCRALNHVLLVSHFDGDMLPHLTGLLHDVAHSMGEDIIMPVETCVTVHYPE